MYSRNDSIKFLNILFSKILLVLFQSQFRSSQDDQLRQP